jgi:hypothetical protein
MVQDDLPVLKASYLRAVGAIAPGMTEVVLSVGGVEATVKLALLRFRNNGSWSLFVCPSCGRLARNLKVRDGRLHCWKCVGLPYRDRRSRLHKTSLIERLIAQFDSDQPARLHPRPGRTLDRRPQLEASLRRNLRYMRVNNLRKFAKALEDP